MAIKAIAALWSRPPPMNLNKSFSEAVAQYMIVHHFLEHGRLTAASAAADPGLSVCPSCTPGDPTFSGPLFLVSVSNVGLLFQCNHRWAHPGVQNHTLYLKLVDGYFSASHRRRPGQEDVPSPLDAALFRQPDAKLEASADNSTGCSSNFVANRTNAASSKLHDVNGIFGAMCPHGCLFDVFSRILSVAPFISC